MTAIDPGRRPPAGPDHSILLPAQSGGRNAVVKLFVIVPFLAVAVGTPVAWGWG